MTRTWGATFIAPDEPYDGAPVLWTTVALDTGHGLVERAILHLTAHGIVTATLGGTPVSDELFTPGWTSYEWRLRYRSHDVTERLAATGPSTTTTTLLLALGNGWYRGRLGWSGGRAIYGDELAALAELVVEFDDSHVQVVGTDETWQAGPSTTTHNDLYDGQTIDARPRTAIPPGTVHVVHGDPSRLVPHDGPPVRRQQVVRAVRTWTSPSGRQLVDFGQNLVGWLRLTVSGPPGDEIVVRHAEVLEAGELGTRPLRSALATDRFLLSGGLDTFEPTMTFHGFRYVEVTGWPGPFRADAVEAVVVHSDLRRIGTFECSDPLLNQLHSNIVWSMRGNMVDLPTDCPQRDERLGWTGDISVFAPTASYLYDVRAFLSSWLADLELEQRAGGGVVPVVVPDVLKFMELPEEFATPQSMAIWSDAAVWVPWALWEAFGDLDQLRRHYPAMTAHAAHVESLLSPTGLWDKGMQLGDWLDPDAPADDPLKARADPSVVATACFYRSLAQVVGAASALGNTADAARFGALAERVRRAFVEHYVSADGVVRSDCPTVYALAIGFGLLSDSHEHQAGMRLAELVREGGYRVATGFAGTPFVLGALSSTGHLDEAYRMLTERGCPSWLYPVTMGATTIWERWDSMLPDGRINPGEMTSFNHYALGAVGDWMHRTIGGIAPLAPGYARALIAPVPGGDLTWAQAGLQTPHGRLACRWELADGRLDVEVTVPDGVTAVLRLLGSDDRELTAGTHHVSQSLVIATRSEGAR
jgi:alpha-L-rhamnosidase